MILQALTAYYEDLARSGKIARQGWVENSISYALELDDSGAITRVIPLETVDEKGKTKPRRMKLPAKVNRRSNVLANFLWDNGTYILGHAKDVDKDAGTGKRFTAAKELHLSLLSGSEDPFAQAICRFFENYDPALGGTDSVLAGEWENLISGCNLTFAYGNQYPGDNEALARAWESHYGQDAEGEKLRCLITGKLTVPEKIHPTINKISKAQPPSVTLVSFNSPAFCSYGREKSENAPVGQYGAFAYTAALNYLLSSRQHHRYIGDDVYVFWARETEEQYEEAFGAFLDGDSKKITDADLASVLDALAGKKLCRWDDTRFLDPKNRFYVLCLAPNTARISVRFFLQDTFGAFAQRMKAHYDRLEIGNDPQVQWPLWALLKETYNSTSKEEKPLPQMSADTLRAILTGGRYPATLFQQTMLRIRAEHDITRGKAAIIKAYLLRNDTQQNRMEALTVKLNDDCNYLPYVLGRLFANMEYVQYVANDRRKLNTTIKDNYLDSACATPSVVFPVLERLAEKHFGKMNETDRKWIRPRYVELQSRVTETLPKHMTLDDQGTFMIGYYHETHKYYPGSKAGQE